MQQRCLLAAFFFCARAFAVELPALHADISAVTVSGLSSGGAMAVQMHVAHSAVVRGAGVIAGAPYYCALGSVWTAYFNCMEPSWWTPLTKATQLKALTESLASAGRIDPTANLAASRAWLFTGTEDHTVAPAVVRELQAYYQSLHVQTVLVADKPAGHAMPTEDAGNKDCAATRDPFINDCDYDAAGAMLKYLLGPLKPPSTPGAVREFDEGFLYASKECEKVRCRVHVAFHGCRQGGERFPREAGYNHWAESNRLIVLYPQVKPSLWNPRGCWDWWGYTGSAYHTRDGTQIRAVMKMLERLSAPGK